MIDGDEVFRSLMDVDLVLQDIAAMGPVKMFLGSVDPTSPALAALHAEILTFKARIDRLVAVAQLVAGRK